MADQVLKYKIELDDSDLAQQLQAIRDRINSEVTSFTAASMTNTPLVTQNGAGIAMLPPETGAFSLPAPSYPSYVFPPQQTANFSNSFSGDLFQNQVPDQQGTFSDFGRQSAMVMQSVPRNVSASMSGAWADLQSFGQNVQTGLADTMPNTQPGGFIANAFASAGFGYDQRLPMYFSDYREAALQEAGKDLQKTGEAVGSFGIDAALGIGSWAAGAGAAALGVASAPILAPALAVGAVALGAAGIAKTALDLTSVESYSELRDTAEGLQTMGTMQLGAFSRADAMDTANMMRDYSKSEEGYLRDINMSDIESAVGSFASTGGLQGVRSADELKDKVETVMKNFREVMHILGTTQEEAASIMGEMERRQLVSAGSMPGFAINMKAQGMYAGLSGVDLMQAGLQVADQFRGTGIGQAAGFQMGIDATLETARLANSLDPYYRKNIYEMGGQQNAAQILVNTVTNTMTKTPLGEELGLTLEAGGVDALGKSIQERMNLISSYMAEKGPGGWFEMKGKGASIFSSLDFNTQNKAILAWAYEAGKLIDPEAYDAKGNINETRFLSIAQTAFADRGDNKSIEELKLMVNAAHMGDTLKDSDLEARTALATIDAENKESAVTLSDRLRYAFGKPLDSLDPAGKWMERQQHEFGLWAREGGEDINDTILGNRRLRARNVTEHVGGNLFKNYLTSGLMDRVDSGEVGMYTGKPLGDRVGTPDDPLYKNLSSASRTFFGTLDASIDEETSLRYLGSNQTVDEKTGKVSYKRNFKEVREDLEYWNDSRKETEYTDFKKADSMASSMKETFVKLTENGKFVTPNANASAKDYAEGVLNQLLPNQQRSANTTTALNILLADKEVQKYMENKGVTVAKSVGTDVVFYNTKEQAAGGDSFEPAKDFVDYIKSITPGGDVSTVDFRSLESRYPRGVQQFKDEYEKKLSSVETHNEATAARAMVGQGAAPAQTITILNTEDVLNNLIPRSSTKSSSPYKGSMHAYVYSNLDLFDTSDFRKEDAGPGGRDSDPKAARVGAANIDKIIGDADFLFYDHMDKNLLGKLDFAAGLLKDENGKNYKDFNSLDEETGKRVFASLNAHNILTRENIQEWTEVIKKRADEQIDDYGQTGKERERVREDRRDYLYNLSHDSKTISSKDKTGTNIKDALKMSPLLQGVLQKHLKQGAVLASGGVLADGEVFKEVKEDMLIAINSITDSGVRGEQMGVYMGLLSNGLGDIDDAYTQTTVEKIVTNDPYFQGKREEIRNSSYNDATKRKMENLEKKIEVTAYAAGTDLVTRVKNGTASEAETRLYFEFGEEHKLDGKDGVKNLRELGTKNIVQQTMNLDLDNIIKSIKKDGGTGLSPQERDAGNTILSKGPEVVAAVRADNAIIASADGTKPLTFKLDQSSIDAINLKKV